MCSGAFECCRDRCARRAKQRAREAEARLAVDVAETEAAAHASFNEEAVRAHILQKRQRRSTRALAREHSRAVRVMAGLPLKEEKEDSDGSDNSGDEQIWLDPFCVFERYFHDKDEGHWQGQKQSWMIFLHR